MSENTELKKRKRDNKEQGKNNMKKLQQATASLPFLVTLLTSSNVRSVNVKSTSENGNEMKKPTRIKNMSLALGHETLSTSTPETAAQFVREEAIISSDNPTIGLSIKDLSSNCQKCICRQWTSRGKTEHEIVYQHLHLTFI